MTNEWVVVADTAAAWQAETVGAALEAAGIAVRYDRPEIGMFGPGFAGATAQGVRVMVPRITLARARQIVDAFFGEPEV